MIRARTGSRRTIAPSYQGGGGAAILHVVLLGVVLAAAAGCSDPFSPDAARPSGRARRAESPPDPDAGGPEPEAYSLLGEPLFPPELPTEVRQRLEANLEDAWEAFDADPLNEERIIWLGRRLGYLGRYDEAVEVYTVGLQQYPQSARLLRHRGHRYITLRRLDDAVADLQRAAELIAGVPDEVEPDGAPNAANIPRSTLHSNIWYHLGLAHYLLGDFARAATAYGEGMESSTVNDDMLCATSYWLYLSLRRLGRDREARALLAPIRADMEILENFAYHRLLLLYAGRGSADQALAEAREDGIEMATTGYGVGAWLRLEGDPARARALFREIVATTPWAAFGHIAAEAELRRARQD